MTPSRRKPLAIGWAPLDQLLDDGVEACLERHWREVGVRLDTIPLAIDWERYRRLERDGVFKVIAAYRGRRLIGYNAFMVVRHLHYRTTWHASNDVIWVEPGERGVGLRLITASERLLKASVAPEPVRILYHVKDHVESARGTLMAVFERLGYSRFEASCDKLV